MMQKIEHIIETVKKIKDFQKEIIMKQRELCYLEVEKLDSSNLRNEISELKNKIHELRVICELFFELSKYRKHPL